MNHRQSFKFSPLLVALFLAACGGGGSDPAPIAPTPSNTTDTTPGGTTPAPVTPSPAATHLSVEQQRALLRRVAQDLDAIRTATLAITEFTGSDDRVLASSEMCRTSGTASLQYNGQTLAAGTTQKLENAPGDYVATYSQCNNSQRIHDGVVKLKVAVNLASGEASIDMSTTQFTQPSIDNASVTLKGAIAGALKLETSGKSTTSFTPQPGLVSEGSGVALSYVSGKVVDVSPATGQYTTQAQALKFTSGGVAYVAQGELSSSVVTGSGLSFSGKVAVTTEGGANVGSIRREAFTDWVIEPASAGAGQ